MPSVLLILAIMMTQPPQATAMLNTDPITFAETGVARTYEATKRISCGDLEWRVEWRSGSELGQIRGSVAVSLSGRRKNMPDAQAQIFDRFETIDSVSATCNVGATGEPIRSALLVDGSVGQGRRAMAQVHVEPDSGTTVSFNPVE